MIGVGLVFLLFLVLHFHTRQNRLIEVPDLHQIPLAEAKDLLFDLRLNFEVIDSTQFNPEIAPLSVIEHQPRARDESREDVKFTSHLIHPPIEKYLYPMWFK